MRYTHTTLMTNKDSMLEYGILGSYCRSGNGRIWLHDDATNGWAENHVRAIHDAPDANLMHIVVEVDERLVKKHSGSLFYTTQDISPECFVSAEAVWTERQKIAL